MSEEERAELLAYAKAGCLLGILHSRARRVLHWQLHDWRNDPFARGAYSYPLVGGANAARQLARLHEDTLVFAGEAASQLNGTVEGALASGTSAARRLLSALRR